MDTGLVRVVHVGRVFLAKSLRKITDQFRGCKNRRTSGTFSPTLIFTWTTWTTRTKLVMTRVSAVRVFFYTWTTPDQMANMKQTSEPMRLLLDLTRVLSAGLLGQDRFGASADDLLLVAAVAVGEAEGKPLSAWKLAEQAGIPRPSVVRKLTELEAIGLVRKVEATRWGMGPGVLDRPEAMKALQEAAKRVAVAAGRVGKG